METSSPFQRLVFLLSCLFASTFAQDAVFQAPLAHQDLTLALKDDYLVQWSSGWPSIDLYVFCGGEGAPGAKLLRGGYNESSYLWTVSQVQSCNISNLFHFMVSPAGGEHGINSQDFRVVADRSELPRTSETPSSTPTATMTYDSATAIASNIETTSSATAHRGGNGLGVGIGVGLGVGLPLSAVIVAIIWYCRKRRARQPSVFTALHTPLRQDQDQYEQAKTQHHQHKAGRTSDFELEGSHVVTRERCELEGAPFIIHRYKKYQRRAKAEPAVTDNRVGHDNVEKRFPRLEPQKARM